MLIKITFAIIVFSCLAQASQSVEFLITNAKSQNVLLERKKSDVPLRSYFLKDWNPWGGGIFMIPKEKSTCEDRMKFFKEFEKAANIAALDAMGDHIFYAFVGWTVTFGNPATSCFETSDSLGLKYTAEIFAVDEEGNRLLEKYVAETRKNEFYDHPMTFLPATSTLTTYEVTACSGVCESVRFSKATVLDESQATYEKFSSSLTTQNKIKALNEFLEGQVDPVKLRRFNYDLANATWVDIAIGNQYLFSSGDEQSYKFFLSGSGSFNCDKETCESGKKKPN